MLTTCFFAVALLIADQPSYIASLRLTIASSSGEAHFDYELGTVHAAIAADGAAVIEAGDGRLCARGRFALTSAERRSKKKLSLWRLDPARQPCGMVKMTIAADGSLSCELPGVNVQAAAQVGAIEARNESFEITNVKEGMGTFGPVRIGGGGNDEQWLSAATFGTLGRVTTADPLPGRRLTPRVLSQGEKRWTGELRDGSQREDATFLLEWQIVSSDSIAGIIDLVPADYLPEPGTAIPIQVHLDKNRARDVEAVQITLEDVSRFPGITTNALNHARFAQVCADCGRPCLGAAQVVEGGGSNRPRLYRAVTSCPLDTYLDCLFVATDNAHAQVRSRIADAPALSHAVGDVLEIAGNGTDRYQCDLEILDGAARASVRARVRVGGAWYDLPTETGESLVTLGHREPPASTDAMGDTTIDDNPGASDREEMPEGLLRGDGLTGFEETRGFLASGAFVRTDAETKDLFVLDTTGDFERELDVAIAVFAKAGLRVHRLLPAEMSREVVNTNTPPQLRAGDQPIVVVLGLQSLDGEESGHFAYVGPPTATHHVIHVLEPSARELIHQLAHQVGIPHHGEGMSVIDTDQGPRIVAVSGGETSGDQHCVMRLRHADLLCSGGRVLEPFEGHRDFYRPYPSASEPLLADEQLSLCTSPEGTGVNDGALGCGNATYGACARRFFVKGNGP